MRDATPQALLGLPSLSPEERRRYGQLMGRQPRRDYLDAIDSQRRALTLELDSDRLLRIPETSSQARAMRRLRGPLRAQIREQMGDRRAFRRPVSVEIDLHAIAIEQPPASPPSVKAYLDLLGKRGEPALVYADDDQVHHLRVRRHAADHPIHRAQPEDWLHMDSPSFPWGPPAGVQVRIVVRPLRLYVADYDRLFRRREQVFGDAWDHSNRPDDDRTGARFWAPGWDDLHHHDRLDELREDDFDDTNDQGLYRPGGLFDAPEMREIREQDRRRRSGERKTLLDRLLLDQRAGQLDRPGPIAELDGLSWALIPELVAMERFQPIMGGVFYLPLPGSGWEQTVRAAMQNHRAKVRLLERPLDTPLSLDIAVRGAGPGRRDYDNLAHEILPPFEEIFCAGRRGTVVSYRVYECEGEPAGVRVMAMTDRRLQDMEDAITTSRDWVLRHGPQLMRDR